MQPQTRSGVDYHERLRVPPGWWALLGFLGLTLVVAVWAILDLRWAMGTAVASAAVISALLLGYGRAAITVDETGLGVDRARIEWPWVGAAEPLDGAATRQVLAEAATGHTWLLVRSYARTSVLVHLDDPADPHQYWLVSTRYPQQLSAAISSWLTPEQE